VCFAGEDAESPGYVEMLWPTERPGLVAVKPTFLMYLFPADVTVMARYSGQFLADTECLAYGFSKTLILGCGAGDKGKWFDFGDIWFPRSKAVL
jgi:hypothetical protein